MENVELYRPKINKRNEYFVKKIVEFSSKYSVVGVVDVLGLPALQFQRIRSSLYGSAKVLVVKKTLLLLALKELEGKFSGISNLGKNVSGVCGLIFTNDNPFSIYKFVENNKSSAPAKSGQVALNDIVVLKGATNFAPGPIIGELGALKIKAGVGQGGKIEIKEDCVVAKEGDVISEKLAEILQRLGVEPMEVGLDIRKIYEEGFLYEKDALDVDEKEIKENLKLAFEESFVFSCEMSYFTSENISYFLEKASGNSLSVALDVSYVSSQTLPMLVGRAQNCVARIASVLPENLRPAEFVENKPVAQKTKESANEESRKEEEESPKVDTSEGLGSLF